MAFMDLFRPRWKHSDPNTREAAIEALTKQSALAWVAMNEAAERMWRSALSRITDQGMLTTIAMAKRAKNVNARISATKRLTDSSVLCDLAKKDKDEYVRQAAVRNPSLNDRNIFAQFLGSETLLDRAAVLRNPNYDDQAVLVASAKKIVCTGAWAPKEDTKVVRWAAVENPHFVSQSLLADIAMNDPDWEVREAAVRKLANPSLLASIAKNDHKTRCSLWVRRAAVENPFLCDVAVLRDVKEHDDDGLVRYAAEMALTKLSSSQANDKEPISDI